MTSAPGSVDPRPGRSVDSGGVPADRDLDREPAGADDEGFPERPLADAVALGVVVLLPLAAVVVTLASRTWLTVAFLVLAPLVLVIWVAGLLAFVKVLRRRSVLRRGLGHVPRRYRVYGWLWSAAFAGSALAPFLGSGDRAWLAQVAVLTASAVAAGIGSVAVWAAYVRDMRWRDAPQD